MYIYIIVLTIIIININNSKTLLLCICSNIRHVNYHRLTLAIFQAASY